MRALRTEAYENERLRIGAKLRSLREQRSWTQAELAARLALSQGRLSRVEAGKASLTAEELLAVLRLFQVGVSAFGRRADPHRELQGTLARWGATHLQEDLDLLPSERVARATDVVLEALLAASSPRIVTALAPVIVTNIEEINWALVAHGAREAGVWSRFRWLLDNILAALSDEEATPGLPLRWRRLYRRTATVLAAVIGAAEPDASKRGADLLDRGVRTARSIEELRANGSELSRRWNVITSIQPQDFADALRGARVGSG